jgi:mRNA-degrading endonuclease RelE of RelBE toxin-antitoxin system
LPTGGIRVSVALRGNFQNTLQAFDGATGCIGPMGAARSTHVAMSRTPLTSAPPRIGCSRSSSGAFVYRLGHGPLKAERRVRFPYALPNVMMPFQIIFNPTSAAELARMPKELQLHILGEFRGLPQQVMQTELGEFGKLERAGRVLHRFRVGDYRVYFERHELGLVVHRILSRHTLKDFLFRSGLKMDEDEALQQNPKFWELIEAARQASAR